LHHRGGEQFDGRGSFGDFTDIGQAANPTYVDFTAIQAAFALLSGNIQVGDYLN
jgi:hypothetical protein